MKRESHAKFCLQLGHSGRKGSTKRGWEGMDRPLDQDNWEVLAASALPFYEFMHLPREITRAEMDRVREDYARAAINADKAEFDMVELHAGHGYLISGFISPLSNHRKDEYGGSLENRLRFPLEVFDTVRANWPKHKPVSVRISASDWAPGGVTPEESLQIAAAFRAHGADILDVSAGQTSRWASPVYGRMFQTPFSEMIRNECGIPTIAVGNITTADQVNTIIAAGRADICALARPHLSNPNFTLVASAEYGYAEQFWPLPYLAGKDQLFRLQQRQNVEMAGLRAAARPSSHDQRRQLNQAAE
jgi:anthraniloyl-CoA monooxygenase